MKQPSPSTYLPLLVLLKMLMVNFSAFAQSSPLESQQIANAAGSNYTPNDNVMRTFDNRVKDVLGSPYLLGDWQPGTVISVNGSIFRDLMLRYDLVEDKILMAKNEGGEVSLPRNEIAEFSIIDDQTSYRFLAIQDPNEEEESLVFCQVLEEGNMQLMIQRRKYYVPGSGMVAFGNMERPEYKFYPDRYFIRKSSTGETLKTRRTNGKVYEFMAPYSAEVKEVSKANGWFVTDPASLLKMVKLYNRLAG